MAKINDVQLGVLRHSTPLFKAIASALEAYEQLRAQAASELNSTDVDAVGAFLAGRYNLVLEYRPERLATPEADAARLKAYDEWFDALEKADAVLQAEMRAPQTAGAVRESAREFIRWSIPRGVTGGAYENEDELEPWERREVPETSVRLVTNLFAELTWFVSGYEVTADDAADRMRDFAAVQGDLPDEGLPPLRRAFAEDGPDAFKERLHGWYFELAVVIKDAASRVQHAGNLIGRGVWLRGVRQAYQAAHAAAAQDSVRAPTVPTREAAVLALYAHGQDGNGDLENEIRGDAETHLVDYKAFARATRADLRDARALRIDDALAYVLAWSSSEGAARGEAWIQGRDDVFVGVANDAPFDVEGVKECASRIEVAVVNSTLVAACAAFVTALEDRAAGRDALLEAAAAAIQAGAAVQARLLSERTLTEVRDAYAALIRAGYEWAAHDLVAYGELAAVVSRVRVPLLQAEAAQKFLDDVNALEPTAEAASRTASKCLAILRGTLSDLERLGAHSDWAMGFHDDASYAAYREAVSLRERANAVRAQRLRMDDIRKRVVALNAGWIGRPDAALVTEVPPQSLSAPLCTGIAHTAAMRYAAVERAARLYFAVLKVKDEDPKPRGERFVHDMVHVAGVRKFVVAFTAAAKATAKDSPALQELKQANVSEERQYALAQLACARAPDTSEKTARALAASSKLALATLRYAWNVFVEHHSAVSYRAGRDVPTVEAWDAEVATHDAAIAKFREVANRAFEFSAPRVESLDALAAMRDRGDDLLRRPTETRSLTGTERVLAQMRRTVLKLLVEEAPLLRREQDITRPYTIAVAASRSIASFAENARAVAVGPLPAAVPRLRTLLLMTRSAQFLLDFSRFAATVSASQGQGIATYDFLYAVCMYGADDARFAALVQDPAAFLESVNVAVRLLEPNAPRVEELRNAAPGTEKTKAAIAVNQFVDPLLQPASEKISVALSRVPGYDALAPAVWFNLAAALAVTWPTTADGRSFSESYTPQWKQHFVQRVVDAVRASNVAAANAGERGVQLVLRTTWTPTLSATMDADAVAVLAQSSTGFRFTKVPVLNEATIAAGIARADKAAAASAAAAAQKEAEAASAAAAAARMAPQELSEFIVTRETCRFLNRRAFAVRFQARDAQVVDYDTDEDEGSSAGKAKKQEGEEEEEEEEEDEDEEDRPEEDERSIAARAEAAWIDRFKLDERVALDPRVVFALRMNFYVARMRTRVTYIAAVFAATFAVLQIHAKARREAFVERAELLGEMFRKTRTAFAEATYAAEQVVLRAAKFAALRQRYGAQETTTLAAALARFAAESTGRVTLQGKGDTENFLNIVERCCAVLAEYGSLLDAFLEITSRDASAAARPEAASVVTEWLAKRKAHRAEADERAREEDERAAERDEEPTSSGDEGDVAAEEERADLQNLQRRMYHVSEYRRTPREIEEDDYYVPLDRYGPAYKYAQLLQVRGPGFFARSVKRLCAFRVTSAEVHDLWNSCLRTFFASETINAEHLYQTSYEAAFTFDEFDVVQVEAHRLLVAPKGTEFGNSPALAASRLPDLADERNGAYVAMVEFEAAMRRPPAPAPDDPDDVPNWEPLPPVERASEALNALRLLASLRGEVNDDDLGVLLSDLESMLVGRSTESALNLEWAACLRGVAPLDLDGLAFPSTSTEFMNYRGRGSNWTESSLVNRDALGRITQGRSSAFSNDVVGAWPRALKCATDSWDKFVPLPDAEAQRSVFPFTAPDMSGRALAASPVYGAATRRGVNGTLENEVKRVARFVGAVVAVGSAMLATKAPLGPWGTRFANAARYVEMTQVLVRLASDRYGLDVDLAWSLGAFFVVRVSNALFACVRDSQSQARRTRTGPAAVQTALSWDAERVEADAELAHLVFSAASALPEDARAPDLYELTPAVSWRLNTIRGRMLGAAEEDWGKWRAANRIPLLPVDVPSGIAPELPLQLMTTYVRTALGETRFELDRSGMSPSEAEKLKAEGQLMGIVEREKRKRNAPKPKTPIELLQEHEYYQAVRRIRLLGGRRVVVDFLRTTSGQRRTPTDDLNAFVDVLLERVRASLALKPIATAKDIAAVASQIKADAAEWERRANRRERSRGRRVVGLIDTGDGRRRARRREEESDSDDAASFVVSDESEQEEEAAEADTLVRVSAAASAVSGATADEAEADAARVRWRSFVASARAFLKKSKSDLQAAERRRTQQMQPESSSKRREIAGAEEQEEDFVLDLADLEPDAKGWLPPAAEYVREESVESARETEEEEEDPDADPFDGDERESRAFFGKLFPQFEDYVHMGPVELLEHYDRRVVNLTLDRTNLDVSRATIMRLRLQSDVFANAGARTPEALARNALLAVNATDFNLLDFVEPDPAVPMEDVEEEPEERVQRVEEELELGEAPVDSAAPEKRQRRMRRS